MTTKDEALNAWQAVIDAWDACVGCPDTSTSIERIEAAIRKMETVLAEQDSEPVATVIKKGAERHWMSERLAQLPDGIYSLYTAPQPAPAVPQTPEQAMQTLTDIHQEIEATAVQPLTDERKKFEAFVQNHPAGNFNTYKYERDPSRYMSSHTQIMWETWQAAAHGICAQKGDV